MSTEIRPRHRVRHAGGHPPGSAAVRLWTHRGALWSRLLPVTALVVVAVIWGVTFSVVDLSVVNSTVIDASSGGATAVGIVRSSMPPADLVAWRFGIGTAVLAVVRLTLIKRGMPRISRTLRWRGVVLGGLLGMGFLLQAWAMTSTDAMMSGFLTGTVVVFAPLAGWLVFRDRPAPSGWVAVLIALTGLAMLSQHGTGFGPGELLTLFAAMAWALHLVLLARWADPSNAVALAHLQIAVVTAMALMTVAVAAIGTGRSPTPLPPTDGAGWWGVLFLAVLATAAAMVLLSWAQSRISATRAAIILTLETAVAGVTAAYIGSELGPKTLVGGGLLLVAMLVVELRTRVRTKGAGGVSTITK